MVHAVVLLSPLFNDVRREQPASPSLTSHNHSLRIMLSHPQTRKAAPETPRPVSETPALTETTIANSHTDNLLKSRRSDNKTPAPSAEKIIAKKALTEEAIAKATFTKEAVTKETKAQEARLEATIPVNESPDTHKPNAYSHRQPDHNSDFEQWLATLQYMINQNKTYPYQARRLNRSGNVEVLLEVNPDGSLIKAEIIRGRKVFHNSTLKAVRSAFPAGRTHKDRPVTLHLTVHYQLRQS